MSGICGIIRFNKATVKKSEIQNLLNTIQNRGRDTEGIWLDNNIGIGQKILWTTPESVHESCPEISQDNSLVLSSDARIDNRKQLLDEFALDEKYNVITDADLILYSYQKWGENCAKYLIGDFAFAIWDANKKKLVCIRDHMGIKPFYYFIDNEKFVFASEISALFSIKNIPVKIDKDAIKKFNALTPLECNKTFYCNIWRLKPGHTLILKNNQLHFKRYWYPERISSNDKMSFEDAKSNFKQVLSEAIIARMRTISGPIGCELSGGLDSSSIVLLANQLTNNEIYTFSATFEDFDCNEKHFVDSILNKTGIKGFFAKFNQNDYHNKYSFIRYYKYSLDWLGRSMFSFFFEIMEKAKAQNVKVILTGFGADEVLPDRAFALSDLLKSFNIRALYDELKNYPNPIKIFIAYGLFPLLPIQIIKLFKFIFPNALFIRIIRVRSELEYVRYSFKTEKSKSFAELYSLKSIISNSVDELITLSIYRFSGRFGLEFRHPFLDKRVIEYILSVPSYYKFSNNKKKNLLRETLKDLLPKNLYLNQKETDFSELFSDNIELYKRIIQANTNQNNEPIIFKDFDYNAMIYYELKFWEKNIKEKYYESKEEIS